MNRLTRATGDGSRNIKEPFRYVSLVVETRSPIEHLPGFHKKTHRLPDQVTAQTQDFVARLGGRLVVDELDATYAALKAAFRFKRTEMKSHDPQDGFGSILTPHFRYTCTVSQHPTNAGEAIWRRDISEIVSPDQLLSSQFGTVFDGVFDTVEFLPEKPVDLELFIDRIEEVDDARVTVDYDRQITFCTIAIDGSDCRIHVTEGELQIVHPRPTSTRSLVQSLFEVQDVIIYFSKLE